MNLHYGECIHKTEFCRGSCELSLSLLILNATDFVYVGGANKGACLLTIELNVSVLGRWWFILAQLLPLVLITVKDRGFLSQGENCRMSLCSPWTEHPIINAFATRMDFVPSRRDSASHYQPFPRHGLIKTCFLVTGGCDCVVLCTKVLWRHSCTADTYLPPDFQGRFFSRWAFFSHFDWSEDYVSLPLKVPGALSWSPPRRLWTIYSNYLLTFALFALSELSLPWWHWNRPQRVVNDWYVDLIEVFP